MQFLQFNIGSSRLCAFEEKDKNYYSFRVMDLASGKGSSTSGELPGDHSIIQHGKNELFLVRRATNGGCGIYDMTYAEPTMEIWKGTLTYVVNYKVDWIKLDLTCDNTASIKSLCLIMFNYV